MWIALTLRHNPARVDTLSHATIRPAAPRVAWAVLAFLCAAAATSAFTADRPTLSWRLHHAATRPGAPVSGSLVVYAVTWHILR